MKGSLVRAFLVGATVAAIAASAAPPKEAEMNKAITAVKAANKERAAALAAGDLDKFLKAYEDDAVWMPPHAPEIIGKEVAAALMKPILDQVSLETFTKDSEHLPAGPDWIAERGHYVTTITPKKPGAKPREEGGNFLLLWHKGADGAWRISWEMWTDAEDTGIEAPARK